MTPQPCTQPSGSAEFQADTENDTDTDQWRDVRGIEWFEIGPLNDGEVSLATT